MCITCWCVKLLVQKIGLAYLALCQCLGRRARGSRPGCPQGYRIIISESFWKRTIALAHESIKACHPCQLVGPRSRTELEYLGIEHEKGIPYWPQSNGEVKRSKHTLLKMIRIANLQGKDWKKPLQDFLFQYQTTSPVELLPGRHLNNKLPSGRKHHGAQCEAHEKFILSSLNLAPKPRQESREMRHPPTSSQKQLN